jgi:hypothetical protein
MSNMGQYIGNMSNLCEYIGNMGNLCEYIGDMDEYIGEAWRGASRSNNAIMNPARRPGKGGGLGHSGRVHSVHCPALHCTALVLQEDTVKDRTVLGTHHSCSSHNQTGKKVTFWSQIVRRMRQLWMWLPWVREGYIQPFPTIGLWLVIHFEN